MTFIRMHVSVSLQFLPLRFCFKIFFCLHAFVVCRAIMRMYEWQPMFCMQSASLTSHTTCVECWRSHGKPSPPDADSSIIRSPYDFAWIDFFFFCEGIDFVLDWADPSFNLLELDCTSPNRLAVSHSQHLVDGLVIVLHWYSSIQCRHARVRRPVYIPAQ